MLVNLRTTQIRIVTFISLLSILSSCIYNTSTAAEADSTQTFREALNWFSFGIGGSSIYFWNLDMSFNLEMQKQRMLTGRFLFSEEIDLTLSGGSSDYETTDYARDFELLYGRFLYTKHTHLSYSIGLSYFINSIYNSIDGFDHHGTIGLPVQVQGYITSVSWLNKNSRGGMGLSLFANLNLEESFWGILISYYLGNNVQVNGDKPE